MSGAESVLPPSPEEAVRAGPRGQVSVLDFEPVSLGWIDFVAEPATDAIQLRDF